MERSRDGGPDMVARTDEVDYVCFLNEEVTGLGLGVEIKMMTTRYYAEPMICIIRRRGLMLGDGAGKAVQARHRLVLIHGIPSAQQRHSASRAPGS
jgi:hypothetical protein